QGMSGWRGVPAGLCRAWPLPADETCAGIARRLFREAVAQLGLEPAVLDDAAAFSKVYTAFQSGTLAALDALPGLVLRRPTVVSVWREGEQTLGELRHVTLGDAGTRLEPVEATRLTPRI
ncbi:MAG TPA: hypothetical protein VMG12_10325, partial [Polyangiaceae bacterium]|nr:hypothetical protein [Polyangiaceae bacterium]